MCCGPICSMYDTCFPNYLRMKHASFLSLKKKTHNKIKKPWLFLKVQQCFSFCLQHLPSSQSPVISKINWKLLHHPGLPFPIGIYQEKGITVCLRAVSSVQWSSSAQCVITLLWHEAHCHTGFYFHYPNS